MPGLGGSTSVTPALSSNVFVPGNQGGMDQNYQDIVRMMMAQGRQDINMFRPELYQAGQRGLNYANQIQGMTPGLLRGANDYFGMAQQYLNPPQTSPIFQNLANQAQQQGAASNAASGVYGPYAANTTNQALNQLMLGWQAQAPGIAQSLTGTGTGLLGAAQGASQAPLSAISNELSGIGNLYGLPQQAAGDALNYLNLGQTAAVNQAALGNLAFQQNQQQLGDIGGLFGSLFGGGALGNTLFGGPLTFGGQGLFGSLLGGGGPSFSPQYGFESQMLGF